MTQVYQGRNRRRVKDQCHIQNRGSGICILVLAFICQQGNDQHFYFTNTCSGHRYFAGCCGEYKLDTTWLRHLIRWQYSAKEAKIPKRNDNNQCQVHLFTLLRIMTIFYFKCSIAMLSHWVYAHRHGTLSQRMGFHGGNTWDWKIWREEEARHGNHSIPYYSSKTSDHSYSHAGFIQTSMTQIFPPRQSCSTGPKHNFSLPWFPHNRKDVTSRCGFITGVNGGSHICIQVHSYSPYNIE